MTPSTIKGSAFPTLPPFECVFEPCVPYPTSFQVRIRALTSFLFEYAFEPLTIKGSAFPILPPLECVFEPSLYFFSSAPSSPRPSKVVHFLSYLLLNAPSSPHLISFRVRFRALDHQSSAFSILPPFECVFEPLPYLFSSAPSSPRPFKVVRFLTLPPFECALEPSFPFERASKPSFPLPSLE